MKDLNKNLALSSFFESISSTRSRMTLTRDQKGPLGLSNRRPSSFPPPPPLPSLLLPVLLFFRVQVPREFLIETRRVRGRREQSESRQRVNSRTAPEDFEGCAGINGSSFSRAGRSLRPDEIKKCHGETYWVSSECQP